jgi:hypothetical protein
MNSGKEYCAGGGMGSERGEPSLKRSRSISSSSSSECDNQISPNNSLSGKNICGGGGRRMGRGEPSLKQSRSTSSSSSSGCGNQKSRSYLPSGNNKGAKSHTISESSRNELTKFLQFISKYKQMEKLQLSPNLNKAQRKFVHELATKLGLISKIYGVKNN